MRKDKIMQLTATWKELEGNTLSKRKDDHQMITFICRVKEKRPKDYIISNGNNPESIEV